MWWRLLFCCCFAAAASGDEIGASFTNHDPDSLIEAGAKCAEAYLVGQVTENNECIKLLNHMDKNKNMGSDDLLVNQSSLTEPTLGKIRRSLQEPTMVSTLREALSKDANNGIDGPKQACKEEVLPYLTMRNLINAYDRSVWATLKHMRSGERVQKLLLERLDQLAGVVSFCESITSKETTNSTNLQNYLRDLKEQVDLSYLKCDEEFDINKKSTNSKKYSVNKKDVLNFYKPWLKDEASSVDETTVQRGVDLFSAMEQLTETGTISSEQRNQVLESVLSIAGNAAQFIPLPAVGLAVSTITSLIGFAMTDKEQMTEVQLLGQQITEQFADLHREMDKNFQMITKEIQDQNLLNLIIVPGNVIRTSIEEYQKTKEPKNIINTCNSGKREELYSGMESYVTDAHIGYIVKIIDEHGTVPWFDHLKELTSRYMMDAIYALAICHGLTTTSERLEKGTLKKREDLGKLSYEDPNVAKQIVYWHSKYEENYHKIESFRERIEDNAMKKADDYVREFLNGISIEATNAQQATVNLVNEINTLWSIRYEYAFMWGNIVHFTLTRCDFLSGQRKRETNNLIISRERGTEYKSYAIVRKLKSNIVPRDRENPLYEFSRRSDFHESRITSIIEKIPQRHAFMNDNVKGERCAHFKEIEMRIPERTRAAEQDFCSRGILSLVGDPFISVFTRELPPFISNNVDLSPFSNSHWKIMTEDNYLDGKFDLIYALGPKIYSSTGTNASNFVHFHESLWPSVYAPAYMVGYIESATPGDTLNDMVALEIDSLAPERKANCDEAYQY